MVRLVIPSCLPNQLTWSKIRLVISNISCKWKVYSFLLNAEDTVSAYLHKIWENCISIVSIHRITFLLMNWTLWMIINIYSKTTISPLVIPNIYYFLLVNPNNLQLSTLLMQQHWKYFVLVYSMYTGPITDILVPGNIINGI